MNTETIDRLFLELSQVTKATTKKELEQQAEIAFLGKRIDDLQAQLDATEGSWRARGLEIRLLKGRPEETLMVRLHPHRPGDPMPRESTGRVLFMRRNRGIGTAQASILNWGKRPGQESLEIIGWVSAEPEE